MKYRYDVEEILSDLEPGERAELLDVWQTAGSAREPGTVDEQRITRIRESLEALASQKTPALRLRDAYSDRRTSRLGILGSTRGMLGDTWFLRTLKSLYPVNPIWRLALVTTAVIIFVVVGIGLWNRPVVSAAPFGQKLNVRLSDGSSVVLNSGSRLTHSRSFGSSRIVSLDGEAFFDVVHSDIPFEVRTFNATIQVHGTRFNVKSWSESTLPETTVYLESGRVSLVSLDSPDQPVTLSAGETSAVSSSGVIYARPEIRDLAATAWMHDDLIFRNEPVARLLEEIQRRFDIRVSLAATELAGVRISGAFRSPSGAEPVLRDLAAMLSIRYRETSDGYELYNPSI